MEPLIIANRVGLDFDGQLVLDGIDVRIHGREFVSLVGPSGCGKTSLLRMIAGLIPPSQGTLSVGGQPAHAGAERLPRRAFVFQDATLLPWRDVAQNVYLPLELQRRPRAVARQAALTALRRVGLPEADDRKLPRMLSGGMKMRVSLARALVTAPDILLLDEPFAALDDLLRQRLNEELLSLWAAERTTAVFVTHNVSEAVYLSQRILVMSARPGRICHEITVPFPYPRMPELRADPQFARLSGEVSRALREGR